VSGGGGVSSGGDEKGHLIINLNNDIFDK